MEQSYAETNVKKETTKGVIALKIIFITIIVLLTAATLIKVFFLLAAFIAAVVLIWYWPRFHGEWEYVFCDGQLDFDLISGGEKRKQILRIEIENADYIAPIDSSKLDGYRHLPVRNYTSLRKDVRVYGIATRLPEKEEKVMIMFEPSDKMLGLMHTKCPNKVELI